MRLSNTLNIMEKILREEARLLASERPQDVVTLNHAKLDVLSRLEIHLGSELASDISDDDAAALERLRTQSIENAQSLKAIGNNLTRLIGKLGLDEAVQVGSYDATGRKMVFERSRGRYENKF
jgi:two-component sensor histidine kinase